MVHDGKGFILFGLNPSGQPTTVGIIDDEYRDIGPVAITQVVNFIHVAIGLVGKAPQMHELITRLDIVGLIGMDQAQLDVANAAEAEGLVACFNRGLDDLTTSSSGARRGGVIAIAAGLNAASCMSLSALCVGRRMPAVMGLSARF
jgi:hypothetical protein